jgi:type IV secretion system protein VirD4
VDEAGNIAPLHTLPKIASTGAGQGITLMTIWQDRAQIRQLYGESERTVIWPRKLGTARSRGGMQHSA